MRQKESKGGVPYYRPSVNGGGKAGDVDLKPTIESSLLKSSHIGTPPMLISDMLLTRKNKNRNSNRKRAYTVRRWRLTQRIGDSPRF